MAVTAKQLLEERAEIIAKARKINDDHSDQNGVLPAEHQQAFDLAMKEAEDKMTAAKRLKSLEDAEAALNSSPGINPPNPLAGPGKGGNDGSAVKIAIRSGDRGKNGEVVYVEVPGGRRSSPEYQAAFSAFLKGGDKALSGEQFAALQSDNSEQAGYLNASEQFAAGLLKEVDDLVFIRQHATVHTMVNADSLGIRKRTARLSSFDWSSELEVATEDSTLAFGKKVLTPHHLTGQVVVSRDLLKRSVLPVDAIVRGELSRDAAEIQEDAFLTGHGAQQPLGVFTASSDGISTSRDVLTGSATNFTADGLVAAKYSLKQQYRNGGARSGARWLFHRDGISKISQLKDGDNHYLLQPARGLTGDEWDTLLGYPVDESERAPNTFTTGLYVGMLCNWSYYHIADALDMELQVLFELLARQNQVVYIGRLKTDGMPVLEEAFVRLKTS